MTQENILSSMGNYNEEMIQAGVLLAGDGLQATSKGARVDYSGTKRTVTDGPFGETTNLVAGFWIIRVGSKEEAIEWAKRVPFEGGQVEIRQVFELSDFPVSPDEKPSGWRQQEQRFLDEQARS
jgi:hypothetical protein